MRKSLVAVGMAALMTMGITACGSSGYGDSGYDNVVQYGYYDNYHHYHYYSHPRTVRVTHHYYVTHRYQYSPHGTQHVVTPKRVTPKVKSTKRSRLSNIFGNRKRSSGSYTRRRSH